MRYLRKIEADFGIGPGRMGDFDRHSSKIIQSTDDKTAFPNLENYLEEARLWLGRDYSVMVFEHKTHFSFIAKRQSHFDS